MCWAINYHPLTWCCFWTWGNSGGSWCSDGAQDLHSHARCTLDRRVLQRQLLMIYLQQQQQKRKLPKRWLYSGRLWQWLRVWRFITYRCTPLWTPRWCASWFLQSESFHFAGCKGAQRCHTAPATTPLVCLWQQERWDRRRATASLVSEPLYVSDSLKWCIWWK